MKMLIEDALIIVHTEQKLSREELQRTDVRLPLATDRYGDPNRGPQVYMAFSSGNEFREF